MYIVDRLNWMVKYEARANRIAFTIAIGSFVFDTLKSNFHLLTLLRIHQWKEYGFLQFSNLCQQQSLLFHSFCSANHFNPEDMCSNDSLYKIDLLCIIVVRCALDFKYIYYESGMVLMYHLSITIWLIFFFIFFFILATFNIASCTAFRGTACFTFTEGQYTFENWT